MKIKKNIERWVVNFYDHKPLSFSSREDMEKYLRGEISEEHGIKEYERIPVDVEHAVYYDIDWEVEDNNSEYEDGFC